MSVFAKAKASRSRSLKSLMGGIAIVGVSAIVLSGCAAPAEEGGSSSGPAQDLSLKLGTALPVTGNLAFLGPPEIAGGEYAVSEINAADLGIQIELVQGDSGDTDNKAYETEIPRLLGEDVKAILGAASSGVSLQFIDQVTGAGVIQFSPANTSAAFTDYDDNGLYFRTAPSDVLQGEVLGNLIAESGAETLGMIVLNDSYGTGLASFTKDAFEAAGGEVVAETTYNTGDTTFDAQISEVLAADPDAIALITFEEVSTIIPGLSGYPADQLYFVDGNLKNFGDTFPAGTLTGAKGTLPGLSVDTIAEFTGALNDFWVSEGNTDLEDFSYAAESYDSVILLALASMAAGSTDSAEIAAKLQEVSGGSGDGEKCTTFADCAAIINDGGTVDYEGISGPITFNDVGDPTEATIGVYQYGEDNNFTAFN
ncbi:branched-chain amino acid ABC transporter substrate-binding protein [Salinibacterium xinjiangense]|uniref:Amino acid/amide ABC transporter substrate-binding protein, HAAT family n=1 Tax=Salinibacterium xinjiangense TaxID=386302 RepID=A0A2C8Z8L8_9MICO|nr:ABC transporter substrate-binding protein [Salinibacterium xinjiangense]GGK91614.1 branched-chain amino acid ABC transporter substrate-binding protein [Salinibacterium xinjiangense]SOE60242.1 amino acid/amide ABC transporter substrate-binding protein, HAAT family [Salinibacterium xinjiangense]